jgi:hypothetical protein
MSFQEETERVLARYAHGLRTAASGGQAFQEDSEPTQTASKRDIPKEHSFDPKALKPLAKTLWACSVSLGHALTAYRQFTRLKSATISPDGRLGGRGYIMGMAELRQKLFDVCESLSSVSDTLHDEISAPHWKPKLAQLDENDREDVSRFVEESQDYLDNPEEEAEEEIKKIEGENDKGQNKPQQEDSEEEASQLPTTSAEPDVLPPKRTKEASSLPVNTLSGPRMESWDRSDAEGPLGSFNPASDATSDAWGLEAPREPDYAGSNLIAQSMTWADSVLPSDDTPTEAYDFGIGFGAHGQGAGGYENPSDEGSGKGVWGPHSGLPSSQAVRVDDSTPVVDVNVHEHHGAALLPNDGADPVARRDEYQGPKGNMVNHLAEAEIWAESLPVSEPNLGIQDLPIINTGYVQEDLNTSWLPLGSPGVVLPVGTPGTRIV